MRASTSAMYSCGLRPLRRGLATERLPKKSHSERSAQSRRPVWPDSCVGSLIPTPTARSEDMTTSAENELLTQIGPGTPMGALLRQYWVPACLSSELIADGDPVRLALLGEKLVAFRD